MTEMVRSWILCRTKFSPYEGDWWEFESREVPGPYIHQQWVASAGVQRMGQFLAPTIMSQTELAKDISNHLHTIDGHSGSFWAVVPYKAPCL